ncbi:uncharacterized protein LOC131597531 [Vicia villosa]|uniref:uncharacterized protein LOC131597531 n=1 Tax=Vicia villosa TaxID=3911 RepID=UPI00273B32F5|nr:uncharacterized protein LOC131597531 [Vicia villosa]
MGVNSLKRKRNSAIIKKSKADMFLIQETKITNMEDGWDKSFWNSQEIGFSFSNSLGRSGGLITLWDQNNVEVVSSFKGDGYLGTKVEWKNSIYYIVNIYSSCLLSKKKELWKKLLELQNTFNDGEWIMGGDFNAIKNSRERKGRMVVPNHCEMELFSEFIDESSLVDVPCKGKKISWFSGDGKSMSRLDRFLVSSSIVSNWGVVGQLIGDRDILDHCPEAAFTVHTVTIHEILEACTN